MKTIKKLSIATDKIISYQTYSDNWHFGEGESFNKEVIDISLKVLDLYNDCFFNQIEIFPGFNGQVLIILYDNYSNTLEVTINKNLKIDFLIINNEEEKQSLEQISFDELEKEIKLVKYKIGLILKT